MKYLFFSFFFLTFLLSGCSSKVYQTTLKNHPILINDQTDSIRSNQAPAVDKFPKFFAQQVNHFKLNNGLTVLHFQTHQQITATTLLGLFLHNPEPYNPFKLKLNAQWNLLNLDQKEYRISALAANLGAEIKILADSIATGWYFEVLQKDQEDAFVLLSKIIKSRAYSTDELLHQKQNYVLAEQLKGVNGLSLSQQLYKNLVFSKQSTVSKLAKASSRKKLLGKITKKDLQDYFNNNFQPKNMILIILSPTPMESLKSTIVTTFKQFPLSNPNLIEKENSNSLPAINTQVRQLNSNNNIYAISRPYSTQVDIRISFTPLNLNSSEYQSIKIFADVLAGRSLNSRMQYDLRERQGLSYSITHQLNQVSDLHSLHFLASTENHKLPALFDGMHQHINFLLKNDISQKEFYFVKQRRLVNLQRSRLHSYRKMSFMLQNFTNQNPLDKISHEAEEISKLTYEEFLAFGKRLKLQPRINILTGDKSTIKHHMCKLQPCTMQWFNKKLVPEN